MFVLFVGDCCEYLAECAVAHDPSAFFIDHTNWKKFVNQVNIHERITGYTSLADLPKIDANISVLWELMRIADEIHYHPPPGRWSDHTTDFAWNSQEMLTEYYLVHQQKFGKKIVGLDVAARKSSSYLYLVDRRMDDTPALWIAGCSISDGVGIRPHEKYGTLIGKSLQKPTYHLAMSGSSLEWQADQILRSDLRQADLLIWGLTSEQRAPLAHNGRVQPWPDQSIQAVEYRSHETRYYKAITSVAQVINYCSKIGCRVMLLPFICSPRLQMDLINQSCYYQLPYITKFIDIGNDMIHPGPKQHQFWADFCLDIIKSKWPGAW